jgi:hypothetical protein
MNGEYGYEFTKGFQEGDAARAQAAEATFGTAYWKASVRAGSFSV